MEETETLNEVESVKLAGREFAPLVSEVPLHELEFFDTALLSVEVGFSVVKVSTVGDWIELVDLISEVTVVSEIQ